MHNPLNKRHKRELKKHLGRYLAIFIIFVTMVMIISGFLLSAALVENGFTADRKENKVEDGEFSSEFEVPKGTLGEVEKTGITIYNKDYKDDKILDDRTLRIFKNREEINKVTYWEGREPEKDDEIALERLSAKSAGLKIGDKVEVCGKDFKVVGIASSPDYSSMFEDNSNLMMDYNTFGVAFVNKDTFDDIDSEIVYTYAFRYEDTDLTRAEKVELNDEIKKKLVESQVAITNYMAKEDNRSISYVSDDMGSDVPMMKAFLYIIVVIIAFVFTMILLSTIEEESATIGTLFAMGMKKREMIIHYLILPVIVMLAAAVVGNILGYTLGVSIFEGMYYTNYSLSPMKITFNLDAFLSTTIYPIVIILIINLAIISMKLSISPLRFIRRDLSRNRKKKAVKLPDISFIKRFTTRVIIRNRGNYITLFLGIYFASFILIFGLCMTPLMEKYIENVEKGIPFEYQYVLKSPYEIDESTSIEKYAYTSFEYKKENSDTSDTSVSISVYGLNDNSKFWDADTKDLNDDEVLVSDTLLKKYHLKVGDNIKFTDVATQKKFEFEIVGQVEYSSGFTAFFSRSRLNELLDNDVDYYSGYLSNEKLSIPDEYTATTITPDDMVDIGEQMLNTFKSMTGICLGASVVIYLVLLYIITKLVMDKNTKSIAFMKIMGYEDKEVEKIYLRATTVVVVISLLVSLPATYVVLKAVMEAMLSKVNGYLTLYVPAYVYAQSFLFGAMLYIIINRVQVRRIKKIEMGEVLKDKE